MHRLALPAGRAWQLPPAEVQSRLTELADAFIELQTKIPPEDSLVSEEARRTAAPVFYYGFVRELIERDESLQHSPNLQIAHDARRRLSQATSQYARIQQALWKLYDERDRVLQPHASQLRDVSSLRELVKKQEREQLA